MSDAAMVVGCCDNGNVSVVVGVEFTVDSNKGPLLFITAVSLA